jgi:hypothetical protein
VGHKHLKQPSYIWMEYPDLGKLKLHLPSRMSGGYEGKSPSNRLFQVCERGYFTQINWVITTRKNAGTPRCNFRNLARYQQNQRRNANIGGLPQSGLPQSGMTSYIAKNRTSSASEGVLQCLPFSDVRLGSDQSMSISSTKIHPVVGEFQLPCS